MLMLGKFIGGGLATFGLAGAAIGVGLVFGSYIYSLSRNPSLKNELFTAAILGMAMAEALGLFSLLKSILILFAL